uniref:Centrosomal protein 89 n=1 Tax=Cynoglossus semilaevis TaxID=244447 RepID=A0A3P8VGB9_CYNSE
MLKKLQRDKDKEFKHIAHGLIPAASIAPKPAVPRTPPPRSPDPSPERPRSVLAAAILSSSLTGQTWAIPPARPRSFSETPRSDSYLSETNLSTAFFNRDRWSEDLESHRHLSSDDHSDKELEAKGSEEDEDKEDGEEEHVYQTLYRRESTKEPIYALPPKPVNTTFQPTQSPVRRMPDPDFTEETSDQSPEASTSRKKVRKISSRRKQDVPCGSAAQAILTTDVRSPAKHQTDSTQTSLDPRGAHGGVQREEPQALPKKTKMSNEQKPLRERLHSPEQEISQSQTSSTQRSFAGNQAELQKLRQQAQELVGENDVLKLTVHRLNVELSRYQSRFRPLSKQESSKIGGLPMTESPPPWLVDMKYLSPLLLAYDDRINEKDALLQTTEEEVKKLRVHVEEVVKENKRLCDEITKIQGSSPTDCHQIQQQAFLVLQENQVLIEKLEAKQDEAKASLSRHQSEVSKVSKQLMLLEAENQGLNKELEGSRTEVEKITRQLQVLQARLQDAVSFDEHCNITGKLRGQLEQLESSYKSETDKLLLQVSRLQDVNRKLAVDKANLSADVEKREADLELSRQENRRAERQMDVLKQEKEACVLKSEEVRQYLGAVITVAEHIFRERDRLLSTVCTDTPDTRTAVLTHQIQY